MLEKLFRIENRNDARILFWALIGPFFLILTLALTNMQTIANADLFAMAAVGLLLCLKYRKKGLYGALSLLTAMAVYKHLQLYQNHLFELGLETSIAIGLFISYLSFEQISEQIKSLEVKENTFQNERTKAEERLAKEIDFHERQHKNFKFEMDRLNGLLEEKTEEVVTLKSLSENLRNSLAEKEKERGVDDLKGKIEEKNRLIQEYENHTAELKKTETLYNQLKNQFEEKKELLQNTRKELFLIKEEAERLKRERAENNSEDNPAIRELQQELGNMNEELTRFEKDNSALEHVVTKVISEADNRASVTETTEENSQPQVESHTEEKVEAVEEKPVEIEVEELPLAEDQEIASSEEIEETDETEEMEESEEPEEIVAESELVLDELVVSEEEAPSDFSEHS